jgi:hypothetical protein
MGWWIRNGLVLRQAVNTHIEEAAYFETQDGEDDYQKYFHGRLLWTHHSLKSIVRWYCRPAQLPLSL